MSDYNQTKVRHTKVLNGLKQIKSAWDQRKLNQLGGFVKWSGLCTNLELTSGTFFQTERIRQVGPLLSFAVDGTVAPVSHPSYESSVAYMAYSIPKYDRRTAYGRNRYELLEALIHLYTNLVNMTEAQHKWVAALRSGEYKQTRGALNTSQGFCCLGVACDVADQEGVPVDYRYDPVKRIMGGTLLPHPDVKNWLNIRHSEGLFTNPNSTTLTEINDSGDYGFDAIADTIELYADQLFVPAGA